MAEQERALVEVVFERCGAFSNTAYFAAIYSPKRRKFVRPASIVKVCADYKVLYRLYPASYILFRYSYWSKRYPPRRITVAPLLVQADGSVAELGGVEVEFERGEFLQRFPPQLADFFDARPGYHGRPAWLSLSEKVYSEEENNRLLELLLTKKRFVEGEENE